MFDKATFFALVRDDLFSHRLSQREVDGMEPILDAWAKTGFTDIRWLAYAFATARGEDGAPMYPVFEIGKGAGHPYGKPGKHKGQVPYGRGYIQTTWDSGYEKTDAGLAAHGVIKPGEVVDDFDLLLTPPIAAPTLLYGLADGWYTKFKLGDYLNATTSDYLNCRRIVNGMDRAADFAAWAVIFEKALVAAQRKASDTSAVIVAKPPAPAVAPTPPAPAQAPASDPLSELGAALGGAIQIPGAILGSVVEPGGPSPAAPASPIAANESIIMEALLPILEGLFTGVAGKIGVATTMATAVPTIVEGTIANLSEAPKAVAEINALTADMRAGKWGSAPADIHALLLEFGVILQNYGINLAGLTAMVNMLPSTPAVAAPVAKSA